MSRKRKIKPSPGQMSLEDLPGWGEATSPPPSATQSQSNQPSGLAKEAATQYKVSPNVAKPVQPAISVNQLPQIPVYVGITFDPCQGIREAKQRWKSNPVPSEVVFDCRPLELATEYACEPKLDELFAPEEEYLFGRGGLLSNAVFINIFRCSGTLNKWSDDYEETGTKPISCFRFIPPNSNTFVGKLWEVLGMHKLTEKTPRNLWTSGVMEFQSRLITPLLLVNGNNRNEVLTNVQDWLGYILARIGQHTYHKLLKVVYEVIKNIVDHGQRGIFGVSVWPSGHIEILWTNPNDGIYDWPLGVKAEDLIHRLLNSSKGAGMPCIWEEILPCYKGLLILNIQTHHFIFRSRGDLSIMGLKPRSEAYLPGSIFFSLHLFCPETRNRNSKNASY